jgi:hypothetical protein
VVPPLTGTLGAPEILTRILADRPDDFPAATGTDFQGTQSGSVPDRKSFISITLMRVRHPDVYRQMRQSITACSQTVTWRLYFLLFSSEYHTT